MKKHISLIALLLSIHCFAQSTREVIIKRSLIIKEPNPMVPLADCNYGLLVPTNIPGKQEVIDYKYPQIQPHHFNKNAANEYYVVWNAISFMQLAKANLEVDVHLKLHTYDLKTAKLHPIKDTADIDTLKYLKHEDNFNTKAKRIKDIAAQITETNREEIVKAIFNYTTQSLDYHIYFYQDRSAKQALRDGKGDCTEYSELMVTLCRAKKIPARIVMGLIPHSKGSVGHHNWVEVYFPQYGWVAFDPTWADSPSSATKFDKMINTYVQLSYKRHISSVLSPCLDAGLITKAKLQDTCTDLTANIDKKITAMYKYYSNYQLPQASLVLDTLLKLEPTNAYFLNFKGMVNARQANYDVAYQYLQNSIKYAETAADKSGSIYALSNYYALKAQPDSAIKYLQQSITLGFKNYKQIVSDTDYYNIKTNPEFIKIVANLQQQAETPPPSKK